jgi:ABC-type antimicrobial peptide transport system permease subunit
VRIVGVVSNVRYEGLLAPADGGIYRPYAQVPLGTTFLVARTSPAEDVALRGIEREIAAVDRGVSVLREDTVRGRFLRSVAAPGFRAFAIGALATVALALAVAGVFGVVSYSVLCRTAEIGVRVAIGASPAAIVRAVLRDSAPSAAAGVVMGVVASAIGARWMSSLLYGVPPWDPTSYVLAVATVAVLAGLAAYVPARRAARLDPMAALGLW